MEQTTCGPISPQDVVNTVNRINRAIRSFFGTRATLTPCAKAATTPYFNPIKSITKNSAITAVIFGTLLHNLLLNNHRLFCCFHAKIPAIPIHPLVYFYMRLVSSTRSIISLKNNLWWTHHCLFETPENRN